MMGLIKGDKSFDYTVKSGSSQHLHIHFPNGVSQTQLVGTLTESEKDTLWQEKGVVS